MKQLCTHSALKSLEWIRLHSFSSAARRAATRVTIPSCFHKKKPPADAEGLSVLRRVDADVAGFFRPRLARATTHSLSRLLNVSRATVEEGQTGGAVAEVGELTDRTNVDVRLLAVRQREAMERILAHGLLSVDGIVHPQKRNPSTYPAERGLLGFP